VYSTISCKTVYIDKDFRLQTYTDKGQTRPLVREGALIRQDRNFQRINKHLVMSPGRGSTPRHTDWPTVSHKVTLTLTLTRLQLKPAARYTSLSTQQATASTGFSSTGQLVLLPVTSDRRPYSTAVAPQDERPRTVVLHHSYAAGQATSHGRASSQLRGRSSNVVQAANRAS
jgi:hypothetical protein